MVSIMANDVFSALAHPARRIFSYQAGNTARNGSVGTPFRIVRICVSDGTDRTLKIVSRLQALRASFIAR